MCTVLLPPGDNLIAVNKCITDSYANLKRIDQALQPVMSNLFPFLGQRATTVTVAALRVARVVHRTAQIVR